jgi:hypothetical protein
LPLGGFTLCICIVHSENVKKNIYNVCEYKFTCTSVWNTFGVDIFERKKRNSALDPNCTSIGPSNG